jgi:hypothetical protein
VFEELVELRDALGNPGQVRAYFGRLRGGWAATRLSPAANPNVWPACAQRRSDRRAAAAAQSAARHRRRRAAWPANTG